MELFDMNNDNTMIALAYLQSSENPYDIFCKYICYALDTDEFKSYNEVNDDIFKAFGISLPFYLYSICMKLLEGDGKVEIKKTNHIISGCKLLDNTFNKNFFEVSKNLFIDQEKKLLNDIIKFAKRYNKDWTETDARKILGDFLNVNSSSIFMDETDNLSTSHKTQIIKQYLNSLSDDSEYKRYVMDIVKGQMILLGSTYSGTERKKAINGTSFYLDTKLVLRLLGYSTEAYHNAIKDLVELIQKKYCGKICVFERTIDEVSGALYRLYINIKNKEMPNDFEMHLYYQLNKKYITADDVRIYSSKESVKKYLTHYNVHIESNIQWDKKEDWIFNIDRDGLLDIIQKNKPNWNINSINNDIDSFIQINMLRKGDYSTLYGGKKSKLPIFVTSNYALVRLIKDYVKNNHSENGVTAKNPFIGDNILMCQLWLPICNEDNKTPYTLYNLTANAISAFETSFFNKLKDNAQIFKNKHKFSVVNIENERLKRIQEKLLKDNVDISNELEAEDIFINIQETFAADQMALDEERTYLHDSIENLQVQLSEREVELIVEKVNKYISHKFSLWKLLYLLSKTGLAFISLIVVIITMFINHVAGYITIGAVFVGFVINWALKAFDKTISKYIGGLNLFFLKKSYKCLEKKTQKYDPDYCVQIMDYVKENTKYFKKIYIGTK